MKFIDEVRLSASSGDGGAGMCAFRKEKYVPKGGPSGGDGGKGGDVVFEATRDLNTLHHLRYSPIIKAKRGGNGGTAHKTGRGAEERVIKVPVGTIVMAATTREVLADLDEHGARQVILAGGRGGRGNARFSSSSNRAPTRADLGEPGETAELQLELKLLADVGLLGFPNAGKSTLVSRLSAARPRVAAYPFTTLEPSLGVVQIPGTWQTFVVADIPGLIEGAAEGAGLGHQFLRHVERCRLLLHLLSLDPLEDEVHGSAEERLDKLNAELAGYDAELARRPQVVLLSKLDLVDEETVAPLVRRLEERGLTVLSASSVTGAGVEPLIYALARALAQVEQEGS
jgi:GTPase